MQEGCRDPLWFYQMVSQFLQPLSPTCLRWHLYYVLKCIGASILYYFYSIPLIYLDVTTPMLSFNHSRFIMHLTPDRICSPLFLFHLKTSLALFTLVSFLHPNCFIGMIPTQLDSGAVSAASFWRSTLCKPRFSSCQLTGRGAAHTQNHRLCRAGRWWCYSILGLPRPGRRTWGSAPGASRFSLLLLWRGLEEVLGERHVVLGRASPPEKLTYSWMGLLK